MADSKEQKKKLNTQITTCTVGEIQENISISSNTHSKPSKEQIINQAINYHSEGKIKEATKYYEYCIDKGFDDYRVFHNYGILLQALGNLKKAEIITRKAIDLNSGFADSYFSLGSILKNLRNLKEAEIVLKKAIQINPNHCKAHLNLGDILYELGKTDEAYISEWEGIKKDPSYEHLNYYRKQATLIKKTAFYIHSFTVFNHFKPILETDPNAFELLVDKKIDKEIISKIQQDLHTKDIVIRSTKELLDNRLIYDKLVSNHAAMNIPLTIVKNEKQLKVNVPIIKLLGKRNIGLMYSAGVLKLVLSHWNKHYIGVLCYGPYHEKRYQVKHKIPTAQIGYPRFDRYFNTGFDRNQLMEKFKCDAKKKTIVWLPTYTDLCSIEMYAKAISSLSSDYNIVVRPHPLMKEDDPKNHKKLFTLDFNYVDDSEDDNLPLYALADLMIFDYGGPMFGALYLNKNFTFLDMKLESKSHILLGELSGEDYIKSFFPERIANLENIHDICNFCIKNPPSDSITKSLREEFFNMNYQGDSGKRAYELLISDDWL